MPKLSLKELDGFLGRFNFFNDAVLRRVELSYDTTGQRSVVLRVATKDSEELRNDGWVCVSLTVLGVKDFRFTERENESAQVLSNGLHIIGSDRVIGLDIGQLADQPTSLDELRSSDCCVTGTSVDWSVEPY